MRGLVMQRWGGESHMGEVVWGSAALTLHAKRPGALKPRNHVVNCMPSNVEDGHHVTALQVRGYLLVCVCACIEAEA